MQTSVVVISRRNRQELYEYQRVNYFAKLFAQGDADKPRLGGANKLVS